MQKQNFFLLIFLAKKSLFRPIKTSTGKISESMNVSQQTVSRNLRELKKSGFISLVSSAKGCEISLTEKGINAVKEHFAEIKKIFSGKHEKEIQGIFCFGFGEGKYYISQKQYLEQFKKLLGFKAFFGTLNLVVGEEKLRDFLLNLKPVFIHGFETKERSFGSLKAFKITVSGISAAIVFPERTRHASNTIEIIAPVSLKKKFLLKEGSKIKIMAG